MGESDLFSPVRSRVIIRFLEKEGEVNDDSWLSVDQRIALAQATALADIADALHKLGIADAHTEMGAMEVLGLGIKEAAEVIATAIERTCEEK